MNMSALLDTGFLLAVLNADDKLHESCVKALLAEPDPILPDVVLPELAYMILRKGHYAILIEFLRSILNGELKLEKSTPEDLARTAEILDKYTDSQIDFVDCVIVAMAERLNIQRIMTIDRRHFQLLRPRHCPYFVIIP
ncbi:MAG: VapC toxin family PIN domain ribonuclease [Candidatus Parabeggiatoa sp. nov. 1]|nr:MAG: VapC toxin family PIN domain ribonuclease [Gammaproteobacteria bacterium]